MILVVYALLALISVLILSKFLVNTKKSTANKIVLCGPSGVGKTAFFLAQMDSKLETVISQAVNTQETQWGPLVDTPGHPKLEALTLAELGPDVKLIIYMVDGASQNLKSSAHLLYKVLLFAEKQKVPVLIAANKYDLFSTVSISKVRQTLEKELVQIEQATERGLDETEVLGIQETFNFDDLETEVVVREGSVKARRMNKWAEFIAEH